MGKNYTGLSQELIKWIESQVIFFVATAPLMADGHVNCSPKGLDTFRVIDEDTVIYQDLTGSGVETIAHIRENGRITIMFCAFEGPPKIVRLYGQARVIFAEDPNFEFYQKLFYPRMGVRAYILVDVLRISDSCGYAVPIMQFKSDREIMDKWCINKGEPALQEYRKLKNAKSIDYLDGFPSD
jgi:Pyridoxamine 5'-phosphate oxidase